MIRIAVAGCCGRMGRRITALVAAAQDLRLASVFERKGHANLSHDLAGVLPGKNLPLITDNAEEAVRAADVLIDFTSPQATLEHMVYVKKHKKKAVIGTTGLSPSECARIKKMAGDIPIVLSPNMSVGVNLLFKLSDLVAHILADDYDVEIVEYHHKHKKDAPSGTAAKLAEIIAATRGVSLARKGVYGRKGIIGEREKGTIGVHAVRGGDVVGEHTVSFFGESERLELRHQASSRDTFARGALVAARFIAKKKKGLYSMQDVLGLV